MFIGYRFQICQLNVSKHFDGHILNLYCEFVFDLTQACCVVISLTTTYHFKHGVFKVLPYAFLVSNRFTNLQG